MKNIVKYIDEFCKKKNIQWVKEYGVLGLAPIKDIDFDESVIRELKFIKSDGKFSYNNCLINENLFLIFEGNLHHLKLKYDFSDEWKNHLAMMIETNKKVDKFNTYIEESIDE